MTPPEYHITKVQANLHPRPGEVVTSLVDIELEMGQGEYDSEDGVLTADCTIEILFQDPEDVEEQEEGEKPDEPGFGEISVDMTIYSEIDEIEFSEDISIEKEVETWNTEGYEHLNPELLSYIESDIVPEVFGPIDSLIRDSITGLLPRFRFTITPQEEEEYERLREEAEENVEE